MTIYDLENTETAHIIYILMEICMCLHIIRGQLPGVYLHASTKLLLPLDFQQMINLSYRLAVDTEPLAEEKNLIAESSIGGESGIYEVDTNQEPYEGMLFESEEAAKSFYDDYARRVGFLTRIVSSRKSERDGSIISRRLACNKEGFNVNSQRRGQVRIRKRESKREGCMAMFLVKREKPGRWVVTKFVREHNHPLVISSERVRPTPDEKDRRIRELSSELHRANQHLAACREQLQTFMTYIEEHNECLSRTVEDVVHRIKEVESEDQTPSQYS